MSNTAKISLFALFILFSFNIAYGERLTYKVKKGDTLSKIALDYGNITYWYQIYKANQDIIDDPSLIYPGQKLTIPAQVIHGEAFSSSKEDDTTLLTESKKSTKTQAKTSNDKAKQLNQFRKAFKKVVRQKKKKDNPAKVNKQTDSGVGLGGMVLNETRSKMGSNFYSIFYKQWQAPKNAGNFRIKISERPMPSRGTLIEIEIDGQKIYQNRLEPRYYKTKQAALRAVYLCQKQLQRQMASKNKLQGY